MTVAELMDALLDLPGETPVHVIFDGTIDESPTYTVDGGTLYLVGSAE